MTDVKRYLTEGEARLYGNAQAMLQGIDTKGE